MTPKQPENFQAALQRIDALQEENEKYREALKFYAGLGCDNREDLYRNRIFQDKGGKAREVLKS